jgi:hypothetical protein
MLALCNKRNHTCNRASAAVTMRFELGLVGRRLLDNMLINLKVFERDEKTTHHFVKSNNATSS